MTERQNYLLKYIRGYIKRNGYAPDYIDMMQHMNLKSKSVVHYYLKELEKAGKIKILTGKRRGIELASTQRKQIEILTKKLKYAKRALISIKSTTSDTETAMYAYDVLFNLEREER